MAKESIDALSQQMRVITHVGLGPWDVDTDTADHIHDLVVNAESTEVEAHRLRETVSHNKDDAPYEVYLATYTIDGEARYAVVYSGPDEVTIEDHPDRGIAERYYEHTVKSLTVAFSSAPASGEFIWDETDVEAPHDEGTPA